jgi:dihydroneopterin aldolase
MADKLSIRGLAVACRLGVLDEERAKAQTIWIDLELEIDASKAAERDDVESSVDYAALMASVKQHVESTSYRLMETLAEDIAALVLTRFPTPGVEVKVRKRALPGIDYAAVEITRRK